MDNKKALIHYKSRLSCITLTCLEVYMVPRAGLEPARPQRRWILSPLRLPIPPPRQGRLAIIITKSLASSFLIKTCYNMRPICLILAQIHATV